MRTWSKIIFILVMLASSNSFALVDEDATTQTKNLYQRLTELSNNKILIGQHTFFYMSESAISYKCPAYEITGKYPAIFSCGFRSHYTDYAMLGTDDAENNLIYNQFAKQHHKRGGIILMSWGMMNFSTEDEDSHDLTGTPIASILPNGDKRAEYLSALDEFYDWAISFKDEDNNLIPIIFRPFHEADGSWFWWGTTTCSDENFVVLWRDLVSYLRDTKGLHSILWCFCPEGLLNDCYTGNRYPGDEYVDIIGIDVYSNVGINQTRTVGIVQNVSAMQQFSRASEKSSLTGKPWIVCEGYRDQTNYYLENYYTDLFDTILSNDILKTMSGFCFWDYPTYIAYQNSENKDNFALLANYPQLGWLEPQKARIKNATIRGQE